MQHLRFAQEGTAPQNEWDEEHRCDEYARRFLLERVQAYAESGGHAPDLVLTKRAVGVAVASFVILQLIPAERRTGTDTHPPVADRLRNLILDANVPDASHFWEYVGSCLVATLRAERRLPARLLFGTPRGLCLELVTLL
jgi:Peptidase U49